MIRVVKKLKWRVGNIVDNYMFLHNIHPRDYTIVEDVDNIVLVVVDPDVKLNMGELTYKISSKLNDPMVAIYNLDGGIIKCEMR